MDVHGFLNLEFEKRKEKNPRTSLRSFARLLEIDPTTLGRILKGKGVPSATSVERFADRLKLDDVSKQQLLAAYKKTKEEQIQERAEKTFKQLPEDFFEAHYEWYFPVLIEALTTSRPAASPEELASSLGLTAAEVTAGIKTLVSAGLIVEESPNNFAKAHFGYALDELQSHPKYHSIQQKYLSLAKHSVTAEEPPPQHYSTLTMTLDELAAEEIIDALKAMRLRLSRLAHKDEVNQGPIYNLCFALHLVSK